MEKPAQVQYPIHDLLQKRWSPRAFSAQPVESDKLRSLFEAARWAPSSFNEQPWSFIVATKDDQADYDRLLQCLLEGNRAWAKYAPVLMLSVAKLRFEEDGEPNRHAFHGPCRGELGHPGNRAWVDGAPDGGVRHPESA